MLSSAASIHSSRRGSGLLRTSSEMQFVSSKNPLIDLRLENLAHRSFLKDRSSEINVASGVTITLQIEVHAYQWRLAEELHQAFWLTRLAHELDVVLLGNHDHAILALAGNALWTLGARPSENLAEARFCALNLPGIAGGLLARGGVVCQFALKSFRVVGH